MMTYTSLEQLWTAIFDLTKAYQVQPLSEHSGCWNIVLPDTRWAMSINGHPEEHESAFCETKVPPFHIFVQYCRWPFAFVSPHTGVIGCGPEANIDTLYAAIVQATERRRLEA